MISIDFLRTIEIFKGLDDKQLEAVRGCCEVVEFQKGDKLFTEGDDATQVWIITDGDVDLRFEMPDNRPTSEEHNVSSVKAQDAVAKILGWSCFVPPYKMRLSAYCVSRRCEIIRIEKKDLLKLFGEDTQMGYMVLSFLIRVVGFRFQQFQDVVAKQLGENLIAGW